MASQALLQMVLGYFVVSAIEAAGYGGQVIYVDDSAPPGGNGASWESAYADLQDALAIAASGDAIRIGQGTYWPDRGGGQSEGDRDASFVLVDGASMLGGFAGLAAR